MSFRRLNPFCIIESPKRSNKMLQEIYVLCPIVKKIKITRIMKSLNCMQSNPLSHDKSAEPSMFEKFRLLALISFRGRAVVGAGDCDVQLAFCIGHGPVEW